MSDSVSPGGLAGDIERRRSLSPHEMERARALVLWADQSPGWTSRLVDKATHPLQKQIERLVPSAALAAALRAAQSAAERIADQRSILRRAGIEDIAELANGPITRCENLAHKIERRAVLLAAGSGAAFGVAGAAGLAADIPSLLLQTFRAIHRIGLCYGEPLEGEAGQALALSIFALASANNDEERNQALMAIDASERTDVSEALRQGVRRSASREAAKDVLTAGINRAARQFGVHLGWRKAAETLPLAGALVGGSVNAWYMRDLCQTANNAFQWRYLARRDPTALHFEPKD